jgi:hypothetical protein
VAVVGEYADSSFHGMTEGLLMDVFEGVIHSILTHHYPEDWPPAEGYILPEEFPREEDLVASLGPIAETVLDRCPDWMGFNVLLAGLRQEYAKACIVEGKKSGDKIPSGPPSGADSADNKKIFPRGMPDDTNVVALAVAIHEEQHKPEKERRKNKQIARDYVGKTGLNPESLLRQVRRATK